MPNIVSLIRAEISRGARKEVRTATADLKKTVATYRSEIAALKRRLQAAEQEVRRFSKSSARAMPAATQSNVRAPVTKSTKSLPFSASALAAQRQRLELSAKDFGRLLGVSALTIYKWEKKKSVPRAKHLPAIAAVRSLGKRAATKALEAD